MKQKYDLLLREQDSTHLQQRKTLDGLCGKVLLNQSLAEDFRAKFISSAVQGIDYKQSHLMSTKSILLTLLVLGLKHLYDPNFYN